MTKCAHGKKVNLCVVLYRLDSQQCRSRCGIGSGRRSLLILVVVEGEDRSGSDRPNTNAWRYAWAATLAVREGSEVLLMEEYWLLPPAAGASEVESSLTESGGKGRLDLSRWRWLRYSAPRRGPGGEGGRQAGLSSVGSEKRVTSACPRILGMSHRQGKATWPVGPQTRGAQGWDGLFTERHALG